MADAGHISGHVSGALGGRFVARRARGMVTVDAEPEALVLHEPTGYFHLLNPAAALVWDCVDGVTSASTIAAEIGAVTGAPFERVLRDTLALLGELRDLGALEDTALPAAPPVPPPPRQRLEFLDERFAAAPEAAELGVTVNGVSVTVRATRPAPVEVLRAALGPLAGGPTPGAPEISILCGREGNVGRDLDRVYAETVEVTRTGSAARVAHVALRLVDDLLAGPDDTLVSLQADALVDAASAVVLVDDRSSVRRVGARNLARIGLRRLDLASATIDPTTGELVVSPPGRALGRAPFDALARALPLDDDPAPPGRSPVHTLVLFGATPDALKTTSPARRMGSLVALVTRVDGTARGADLTALARLADRWRVVRELGLTPDDVRDVLQSVVAQAGAVQNGAVQNGAVQNGAVQNAPSS
ncbi:MAG TPA: PqqD family protein [Acidimicrobiia bacterium]